MNPRSSHEPSIWDNYQQVGVASMNPFVQGRIDRWRGRTCPFCLAKAGVWWMRILTTYSLQCGECGQVVEGFELYQTQYGEFYMQNHVYPQPEARS